MRLEKYLKKSSFRSKMYFLRLIFFSCAPAKLKTNLCRALLLTMGSVVFCNANIVLVKGETTRHKLRHPEFTAVAGGGEFERKKNKSKNSHNCNNVIC